MKAIKQVPIIKKSAKAKSGWYEKMLPSIIINIIDSMSACKRFSKVMSRLYYIPNKMSI